MRTLPAALGLLALAAAVVAPLAPWTPPPRLLAAAGVALLALGLGALSLSTSLAGSDGTAPFAARSGDAPAPGDEVDAMLASLSAGGRRNPSGDGGRDPSPERRELRRRLSAAGVEVLVGRTGCTPEQARQRLRDGSWTDDTLAAAYFRGDDVSRRAHLRALATGEPPTRRRARRAIDELHRLEGAS